MDLLSMMGTIVDQGKSDCIVTETKRTVWEPAIILTLGVKIPDLRKKHEKSNSQVKLFFFFTTLKLQNVVNKRIESRNNFVWQQKDYVMVKKVFLQKFGSSKNRPFWLWKYH